MGDQHLKYSISLGELERLGPSIGDDLQVEAQLSMNDEIIELYDKGSIPENEIVQVNAFLSIREIDTKPEFDDFGSTELNFQIPGAVGVYKFPAYIHVKTRGGDRVPGTVFLQEILIEVFREVEEAGDLPAFAIPDTVPIVYAPFIPWTGIFKTCSIAKVTRTEEYSRGNNDLAEMRRQRAKTPKTQYETGKFKLKIVADPSCVCVQKTCIGAVALTVDMEVILYNRRFPPDDYMLVPVPDPSKPTTAVAGGKPPGPDVNVTVDPVTVPAPKKNNKFVQPNPAKGEYKVSAANLFPCTPGTYNKRFMIFPKFMAGRKYKPDELGLIFILDINVTVKTTGKCKHAITMETFMMEFRNGYDFTHGGALPRATDELPVVKPTFKGANAGKRGVNTHNIAKRTKVNGKATDTPFPKKAP